MRIDEVDKMINVYFTNIKDSNGNIIGPVELDISDWN